MLTQMITNTDKEYMKSHIRKYLQSFPTSFKSFENIVNLKPEHFLRVMILTEALLGIPTKIGVSYPTLTATLKVQGIKKLFGTRLIEVMPIYRKFVQNTKFRNTIKKEFEVLLKDDPFCAEKVKK